MKYSTVWQRFAAFWIDGLIFAPLIAARIWAEFQSKTIAIALLLPMALLFLMYRIYGHARFG